MILRYTFPIKDNIKGLAFQDLLYRFSSCHFGFNFYSINILQTHHTTQRK